MHNRFRVSTTPAHRPPVTPDNLATPRTPISAHPGHTSQHPLSVGSSTPLIPSQRPLSYQTPSNLAQKRKRSDNKENELPHLPGYTQTSTSVKKRKPYSARKTTPEKLEVVFTAIEEAKWGLGEFLYEVFRLKNEDGDKVHRSKRHAGMVQRFLQGNTRHTPAMIIDAWFRNPDGCISAGSAEDSLMYSTDTPYLEIQSIRAALTSFAVQIVEKKVVKEAQVAVHPTSGLHATKHPRHP